MSFRNNTIMAYIVACMFVFMHSLLMSLPISMSSHFQHELGLDSADVANLYSAYFIASIFIQLPLGVLLAKYGLRRLFLVNVVIAGIGFSLHMFSHTPSMLMVSRIISGISNGTAYVFALYIAMNFFKNRFVAFLIGIIEVSCTFGSIAAAGPTNYLLSNYGWEITNEFGVLLFIIILILGYLFIHDKSDKLVHIENLSSIFRKAKNLIIDKNILLLMGYAFLSWLIIMSFAGYWIRDYMIEVHNYTEHQALFLSELYWWSFLFGNLLIGIYANTLTKVKYTMWFLSKLCVITFVIMVIPSIFGYNLIVIFCLFAGVSASVVILSFTLVSYLKNDESERDIASSLVNTSVILGGVCGQFIYGYIIKGSVFLHVYKVSNPLFTNGYYLGLWIYLIASILGLMIFFKLMSVIYEKEKNG